MRKSVLAPVMEDKSTTESSAKLIETPIKEDKDRGWVGIGFDGEAIALSVCSGSPESTVEPSSLHNQPIPKAIDFKRFESDNLPIVEEDISIVDCDNFLKERSVARRVLQDVEELSVDLGVLDDMNSISSVVTMEGAIYLAKRLEKMESQLLGLAGETGKMDALHALAKATHKQSKRADSLQRKVGRHEKKISTLNDLCQRLLDGKQQDNALRSTMQKEIDNLKDSNVELTLRLHRSESRSEEMTSKLAEMPKILCQMEEENCRKNANNQMQAKCNELREENRLRAEEDKATIKKLESEMTAMAVAHARIDKRSKSKIQILIDMKSAMEEQIRFLEGNGSPTE